MDTLRQRTVASSCGFVICEPLEQQVHAGEQRPHAVKLEVERRELHGAWLLIQ
jgi:hypothetical protein